MHEWHFQGTIMIDVWRSFSVSVNISLRMQSHNVVCCVLQRWLSPNTDLRPIIWTNLPYQSKANILIILFVTGKKLKLNWQTDQQFCKLRNYCDFFSSAYLGEFLCVGKLTLEIHEFTGSKSKWIPLTEAKAWYQFFFWLRLVVTTGFCFASTSAFQGK